MSTMVKEIEQDPTEIINEGPGHRLRSLREAQNLDISRVSVLLHLKEDKVMALEADDYASLPGPVFIQGYLRNYARLLGVPVEPILKAYHIAHPGSSKMSELKIAQVSHEVRSGHTLVRLVTWAIVLGLIVLSVVWWRGYLQWPLQSSMVPEEESVGATGPLQSDEEIDEQKFPVVEVNEDGSVTLGLPQPSGQTPEVATESNSQSADSSQDQLDPPKPSSTVASVTPDSEQRTATEAAPTQPEAGGSQQVVVEFTGTSWTKIEDSSGTFKVEGSSSAGSRRILQGVPPYRMVLGNASAVRILVNGREFDLTPFSRGNVARFTLDPEKVSQ